MQTHLYQTLEFHNHGKSLPMCHIDTFSWFLSLCVCRLWQATMDRSHRLELVHSNKTKQTTPRCWRSALLRCHAGLPADRERPAAALRSCVYGAILRAERRLELSASGPRQPVVLEAEISSPKSATTCPTPAKPNIPGHRAARQGRVEVRVGQNVTQKCRVAVHTGRARERQGQRTGSERRAAANER